MLRKIIIISLVCSSSLIITAQNRKTGVSLRDTITDKDLVVPEEIERNFDQLLIDWRKEFSPALTCNSNVDTDVVFEDSIYINRLYSLPTVMELAYNPIVKSYISMYTGRMRNSVEYFVGKSSYYFPIFEQALDKYGLPLELKYLPIIESALNPTIVSRAGATGLWQFMIGTGKMYDLEVNSLVDERRDPLKSTDAAARYLKDLFNIYGDWNLVIAAYNCGPGNVNKAIKRSGGATDYWAIYPYLPRETRGYVPAFIAATYVMNYYSDHNICPFEYKYTRSTDTIVVDKYLHLQQVADVLGVPIDEVRNLNPQYKKDIVPGEFKRYLVTLPSAKAADFEVSKDSVYAYRTNEFLSHRKVVEPSGYTASAGSASRYRVRRGDNIASIARKHGISTTQIKRWNGLRSNRLKAGQYLVVSNPSIAPRKEKEETSTEEVTLAQNQTQTENTATNTASAEIGSKTNESSLLAQYFNKMQEKEVSDNNGSSATEDNSNTAATPTDNKQPRIHDLQSPQTIYHKVRIGETLTQIASKYSVDKDDITQWNKLKKSVPKVGQRLVIHLPQKAKEEDIEENVPSINAEAVEEVMAEAKKSAENETASQAVASISPVAMKKIDGKEASKTSQTPEPKKSAPKVKVPMIYVVKKGDTLGHIASRYGGKTTASSIRKANNLKSDNLSIGQKLKIPR
nr:LysM peptidoglycan-binding domain-containing protein [Dysgonomonas capnocytophagoides]